MGVCSAATPWRSLGPKRPFSYNEGSDEAPKVIDAEPTDIEGNLPAEERSSVEGLPKNGDRTPPVFEE